MKDGYDYVCVGAAAWCVLALYALIQYGAPSQQVPHSSKSYLTYDHFYPLYLFQHSQPSTRRCHLVGTLLTLHSFIRKPAFAVALVTGMVAAWPFIEMTRASPYGIVEGLVLIGGYLLTARALTRGSKTGWGSILLVPLLGYGFAWIGHFYFEENKPATFIYPVYSMIGDWSMMWDIARGEVSL